jgi:hypothetical protein
VKFPVLFYLAAAFHADARCILISVTGAARHPPGRSWASKAVSGKHVVGSPRRLHHAAAVRVVSRIERALWWVGRALAADARTGFGLPEAPVCATFGIRRLRFALCHS